MLEKQELVEQTIEMYDEFKKMRACVQKYLSLLSSNATLSTETMSELSDVLVTFFCTEYKFIPSAKDYGYLRKIQQAIISGEEIKIENIACKILTEIDEVLRLFNADEIERLRNSD